MNVHSQQRDRTYGYGRHWQKYKCYERNSCHGIAICLHDSIAILRDEVEGLGPM